MSGPVIDRTAIRYIPALGVAPACEHPGLPCLRLVFADLHHPAVPAVAAALRQSCPNAFLVGVTAQDPLPPPPPGVDAILDQRLAAPFDLPDAMDEIGCDTILPLSLADVWQIVSVHEGFDVTGLHFVYPIDSLSTRRAGVLERLSTCGVPVVPDQWATTGDELRAAAAGLGYPGTDLIVLLNDIFHDSGPWTVTERPDLTARGRQVTLAAMAAIFDQRQRPNDVDAAIVRPATAHPGNSPESQAWTYMDCIDPGSCTVDIVADGGTILAVLARRTATSGNGGVADTTLTLTAAAQAVVTAAVAHLQWTGAATITLTGLPDAPAISDVLPWLDPAAHVGTYAGADIINTAVRHARGEYAGRPAPNWAPTTVTARRSSLIQRWSHLP